MSRFLTREELYARRGEGEILRLAGGSTDAVDAAIAAAEADAVSYLVSRYGDSLPVTPETTPAVLKDKLAILAHRKVPRGGQVAPSLLDEAREVTSWLGQVSRGIASLGLTEPSAVPVDRSAPAVLHTAPAHQVLDFNFLRRW